MIFRMVMFLFWVGGVGTASEFCVFGVVLDYLLGREDVCVFE